MTWNLSARVAVARSASTSWPCGQHEFAHICAAPAQGMSHIRVPAMDDRPQLAERRVDADRVSRLKRGRDARAPMPFTCPYTSSPGQAYAPFAGQNLRRDPTP
jgi:hypothetical protein